MKGLVVWSTLAVVGIVSTASALALLGPAPERGSSGRTSQSHQPANKVSVAASSFEVFSAPVTQGAVSEVHTLLGTSFRTSGPADLVFQVALECALWTDVAVQGNGDSTAVATVKVWVEYDGVTLPVAADEDPQSPELGRVTFCNRHYQFSVMNLDDEDAEFEQFLRTRAANGFNWIRIDAGSGIHTVEVKAQLEAQVDGVGMAKAGVGKRTLVVEPVHLSNHATL